MLSIGISANTIITLQGEPKKLDGIGTYTNHLIEALKSKVQIEKILFHSRKRAVVNLLTRVRPQHDYHIQLNPLVTQFWPFNCYDALSKHIDLFHSTDYLVPKIKRKPVVATLHDAIMLKNHTWTGFKYPRLEKYALKKMVSNANAVITVSYAAKQEIHEYWKIPLDKITAIYHGMLEFWFNTFEQEVKSSVLKSFDICKPFYLIVGTLQPRKNIDRILAAYQALPDKMQKEYMLVFVGGRGWLSEASFDRMMRLQTAGYLKWLQHVPLHELQCLYQSAHLVLFPSLSEGFGIPILEGFASHVPVITSHLGATEEIAGGCAYLVDPSSTENITEAMKELSFDQTLRDQCIAKGIARAREFTWERCAEETLKVYRSVVE